MLKNLALAAMPLSLMFFIACSDSVELAGGGTIDPNANRGDVNVLEPESSSSSVGSSEETNNKGIDVDDSRSSSGKAVAGSSSSSKEISSSSRDRGGENNLNPNIDPLSSSSDNGEKNGPISIPDTQSSSSSQDAVTFFARNFSAQCIIDYVKVDSAELVPVTDEPVAAADVLGASAYKSVDGDSVNIYLDGAYLNTPCDSAEEVQFFEEINSGNKIPVGLVNDTLSMTLRWDKTCACAATVSFTLDKPDTDFNYIIFDLWMPILFEER
jgi:hypothetical protein